MNGPEHYREAERLIARAADPYDVELTQAERNTIALGAITHALLANAAGTALGGLGLDQWVQAAGDPPRDDQGAFA